MGHELTQSPVKNTVRSFLNHLWFHPLLNEKTLAHRAAFPTHFHDFCQAWELDEDSVVAGPLGSSVWVVNDNGQSDFDLAIYFATDEIYEKWHQLYNTRWQDDRTPDMHSVYTVYPDCTTNLSAISPFYFIPDEYLVGNLNLAWDLRLKGPSLPNTGVPNNRGAMQYQFSRFYYWYRDSNPDRFRQKLQSRAAQFASTKPADQDQLAARYIFAYLHSLKKFQCPSDEAFLQAISTWDGHILL